MKFIAEIGLNHNGSEGLLVELIRQASLSGATMAKFQLGWRDKSGEINHLNKSLLKLIYKACEYYKIEPLFSIFHQEAWKLINSVAKPKIIKIASRTFSQEKELVKDISNSVHEIIVSTGMSDKKRIDFKEFNNASFLWCESKYPHYSFDIDNFPKEFNNDSFKGLSDHSLGLSLSLLAISRGAKIIERHFTLDKSDQTIRDHALSSTPDEFSLLVKEGMAIHNLLDFIGKNE